MRKGVVFLLHTTNTLQFLDQLHYPEITIDEGSFCFLTGKSGCGKSTYLKLLNGTLLPAAGEIFYRGQNIRTLPPLTYRREVLLIPQEVFLLDDSIAENFAFYYDAREEAVPTEETMEQFLTLCCLDKPLTASCKTLSGGERQRVFLAIFLSFGAKVLLLDEPTAALDEATARAFLGNLNAYVHETGRTALTVCHSTALAEAYGDRIISLGGAL